MANDRFDAFDPEKEGWSMYCDRFEQFLISKDVQDEKISVATFLSTIGPETYKLLTDLVAPDVPNSLKLADLQKHLQTHYEPSPVVIAERYKFYKRDQLKDESAAKFLAALRQLAETCDFGTFLNEALRDRFVCGLSSGPSQRRLLAEQKLDLAKAYDIAQAMEAAEANTKALQHRFTVDQPSSVNHLQQRRPIGANNSSSRRQGRDDHRTNHHHHRRRSNSNSSQGSESSIHSRHSRVPPPNYICWRCGVKGKHLRHHCTARTQVCGKCFESGHVTSTCEFVTKFRKDRDQKRKSSGTNHHISTIDEDCNHLWINSVTVAGTKSKSVPRAWLSLDGKRFRMPIDSGAAVTVLSENTWRRRFPDRKFIPSKIRLKSYPNDDILVLGQASVRVSFNNKKYQLPIIIVKGKAEPIIGRNWIQHLDIDWSRFFDPTVQQQRSDSVLPAVNNIAIDSNNIACQSDSAFQTSDNDPFAIPCDLWCD